MNTELIHQYAHTWRTFQAIVSDFSSDGWLHTGRGVITPARLSFHMLQSMRYYIEDKTFTHFDSGLSFDLNWETAEEKDIPSQQDIIAAAKSFEALTETWLGDMDLVKHNATFDWAGETLLGLALFTLRHFVYHMGELSSLLNESLDGRANDNFRNTVNPAA